MAAHFLDSSALVKRYLDETGSDWIRTLLDPSTDVYAFVAEITLVEVIAALTRRARGGGLSSPRAALARDQVRLDFQHEYVVTDTESLRLQRAADVAEQYGLRAYDAVQLASLLVLNEDRAAEGLAPVGLVSADVELNIAAAAEGLLVEDPNAHP